MTEKFKVGDTVMPEGFFASDEPTQVGKVVGYNVDNGTRGYSKQGTLVGVSFPEPFSRGGHSCEGLIPDANPHGWWFQENELSLHAGTLVLPAAAPASKIILKAKRKKIVDKDWELIEKTAENPMNKRILFYGPPGTGKTTFLFRLAARLVGDASVFMTTLHEESVVEELIGHWVPKGSEFCWHHGFATLAYKAGVLIVNEPDRASGSVLSKCHEIFDDPEVARLCLPNGEVVKPHEGFRAFASMNGHPDDLHEALRDRFDVKIYVPRPHPGALDLLDDDLVEMVLNAYSNPASMTLSYRSMRSFQGLRKYLDIDTAAKYAFGDGYKDIVSAIKLGKN